MSDPLTGIPSADGTQLSDVGRWEHLDALQEKTAARSSLPSPPSIQGPECVTHCRSWMMLSVLLALSSTAGMVLQADKRGVGPAPATDHFQIDVNRAEIAELRALPGIGPGLAKRIVDFRQQNGPFSSPSDLIKVPGLGPSILMELSPFLTVSPELYHFAE